MVCPKNNPLTVREAKERLRLTAKENPSWLPCLLSATRQHPKAGLLTAFATGLLLGASPGSRRMIQNLLPLVLGKIRLPASSVDNRPSLKE